MSGSQPDASAPSGVTMWRPIWARWETTMLERARMETDEAVMTQSTRGLWCRRHRWGIPLRGSPDAGFPRGSLQCLHTWRHFIWQWPMDSRTNFQLVIYFSCVSIIRAITEHNYFLTTLWMSQLHSGVLYRWFLFHLARCLSVFQCCTNPHSWVIFVTNFVYWRCAWVSGTTESRTDKNKCKLCNKNWMSLRLLLCQCDVCQLLRLERLDRVTQDNISR